MQLQERRLPAMLTKLRAFLASQPTWPWYQADLALLQPLQHHAEEHVPLRHLGPVYYLEWRQEEGSDGEEDT